MNRNLNIFGYTRLLCCPYCDAPPGILEKVDGVPPAVNSGMDRIRVIVCSWCTRPALLEWFEIGRTHYLRQLHDDDERDAAILSLPGVRKAIALTISRNRGKR